LACGGGDDSSGRILGERGWRAVVTVIAGPLEDDRIPEEGSSQPERARRGVFLYFIHGREGSIEQKGQKLGESRKGVRGRTVDRSPIFDPRWRCTRWSRSGRRVSARVSEGERL